MAAAINAAFGRFANPAATWLMIGGDEYSICSATTMKHYDKYLTQPNVSPARTVMTPGNHTNGPGGKSGGSRSPTSRRWLAYNQANGTLTRTTGGWIDQPTGIPLTDQYVDVAGIRFIFLNSGAVENLIDKPGWPVPSHRRLGGRQRARRVAALGVGTGAHATSSSPITPAGATTAAPTTTPRCRT